MKDLIEISGVLQDIIYHNEANGYTVGLFESDPHTLMVVGILNMVSVGDSLELKGYHKVHPKYGEQFEVESFKFTEPTEIDTIQAFLASGKIHGIGESMAQKIVERFGENALSILENYPDQYLEISGIGKETLKKITSSYRKIMDKKENLLFLQELGVKPALMSELIQYYGDSLRHSLESDPYQCYLQFPHFGFNAIDQLASKLGVEKTSPQRIYALGVAELHAAQSQGHCYLEEHVLLSRLRERLPLEEEEILRIIEDENVQGYLVLEEDRWYLQNIYRAELMLAADLLRVSGEAMEPVNVDAYLRDFQKKENLTLEDEQWQAVSDAYKYKLSIVTGGPGTGKTTLIKAICHVAMEEGLEVGLGAPTGRAAKRMEAATDLQAKTIHRLLEYQYSEDSDLLTFMRNRENPLELDVLVIDEASMVDVFLFSNLLEAVGDETHLIIIGDKDQLPPVGPGSVLRDLLETHLPITRLSRIHRQHEHSLIPLNASKVIRGEDDLESDLKGDFFIMRETNPSRVKEKLKDLILKRLPEFYGFQPLQDIQVLTPMKNTALGTKSLNAFLQEVHQGETEEKGFLVGDKIMQMKNNYNLDWSDRETLEQGLGVFNGDIGVVEEKSKQKMRVLFDEHREVTYDKENQSELELAYAMTVHKSQGSEFSCVILVLGSVPPMLRNRNVLYTAMTRAKKLLIILGDVSGVHQMIERQEDFLRNTSLVSRMNIL